MTNLKLMVKELAALNEVFDFKFSSLKELNKKYDLSELEEQASFIRQDLDIQSEFLDGESDDVNEIVFLFDVKYLNDYLNEVYKLL